MVLRGQLFTAGIAVCLATYLDDSTYDHHKNKYRYMVLRGQFPPLTTTTQPVFGTREKFISNKATTITSIKEI
jgi:hypothetical protein